jgi:DNA-binding response OmpR family regulator
MTANILLVTPHYGFGQLLQKKLDGLGDYRTTLSSGMASALSLASRGIYNLAILDSACVEGSITRISTEVRKLNPGIRQLVILHKSQKAAPGIGNIDVDEWLLLPFTINELNAAVEQVLTDTAQPENTSQQSSEQRVPEITEVDKQSKDLPFLDNTDSAIRWRLTVCWPILAGGCGKTY